VQLCAKKKKKSGVIALDALLLVKGHSSLEGKVFVMCRNSAGLPLGRKAAGFPSAWHC